jgi:hypothetical protein
MSDKLMGLKSRYVEKPLQLHPLASVKLGHFSVKGNAAMIKTLDSISEIIRNPKHPFRKVDDRPVKAQKHRYERRKIKEYIKLGDWAQQSAA